jgi:hypothetical protein
MMFYSIQLLKRPKLEIVGSGVFALVRPVWIGDLETRPKISKSCWVRLDNRHFVLFIAVADIAKKTGDSSSCPPDRS